jgi:hypothetical protein
MPPALAGQARGRVASRFQRDSCVKGHAARTIPCHVGLRSCHSHAYQIVRRHSRATKTGLWPVSPYRSASPCRNQMTGSGAQDPTTFRKLVGRWGCHAHWRRPRPLSACWPRRIIVLPLLALHFLAARRGDGLRPELLALLKSEPGGGDLSVRIEAESQHLSHEKACATETSAASASEAAV